MGFEDSILKTSCIAFHVHYNCIFMHLVVCYTCWTTCVLVDLDWTEPMMQFLLHVTCSCIPMHTYSIFNILAIFELFGTFLIVFFFPLSLSCLRWSCLWHQNINMLHPRTLCILGPPLLLILLLLISEFWPRMTWIARVSFSTTLDHIKGLF